MNESNLIGEKTLNIPTHSLVSNRLAVQNIYKGINFKDDDSQLDITNIIEEMINNDVRVNEFDNLDTLVTMLTCQATTLQSLFTRMTSLVLKNTEIDKMQALANIALKAQNQCRTTVLAIAEIKNPKRTTFIKQQTNQSLGHMQVNNATLNQNSENLAKNENELMESNLNEQRLDTRTAQETIGINPQLATVDKINGRENRAGQKDCVTKRTEKRAAQPRHAKADKGS